MTASFRPAQTPRAVSDPRRRHRQLGAVTSVTAAVLTALYGARVAAAPAPEPADEGSLQEVTVTATRRAISAQDIPISITAVTGAALEAQGIQDIAGLAHSMAGVNFTDKGPFGGVNGSTLIIRGLNSEPLANQLALATPVVPPVATYVDETPLFVNLRLQDLDHVEILRGPQGTLYGSGSLGGTIRFVQNAPDPKGFDAKVEAGVSKTAHTHTTSEDITGMLNIPVTDSFALRFNAGASNEAGFINQPNLYRLDSSGAPIAAQPGNDLSPPVTYGEQGVNSYQYRNVRLAALFKPGDDFKAQLSYFHQEDSANGFPYVATQSAAYNQPISPNTQCPAVCGGYVPTNLLPQLYNAPLPPGIDRLSSATNSLEGTDDKVDLVALNIDYDMGPVTFASSSSWAHHNNQAHDDLTALYENFSFYQNFYGQNPRHFVQGQDQLDDKVWSQEFRLASKTGGLFDWVAGLFYKDEKTYIQEHEFYPGYNNFYNNCTPTIPVDTSGSDGSSCGFGEYVSTGATSIVGIPLVVDQAYIGDFHTHFKDMAVFGELTWHLTDAWSLTGGTRVFKQTVDQSQQTGLLFDGPGFAANASLGDQWRKALFKLNTAFQIDKANLVYATWSQGFRRGGVNALPASEPIPEPPPFGNGSEYITNPRLNRLNPDTVDNYEIGFKGTYENRFSYSAAIFDMQWHNVQEGVQLTPLVLPAALNIGDATSRGLEVELNASFTRHWAANLDYTYDQTKLTSISPSFVFPDVSVPAPAIGSPLPGTPKTSVALGLEYQHVQVGEGELRFAANGHYQSVVIPALSATVPSVAGYTMVDTRITYTQSHWMAALYCDNVTNNLGIGAYTDPALYGNRWQAVVSRPRTVGITVGYSFKGY